MLNLVCKEEESQEIAPYDPFKHFLRLPRIFGMSSMNTRLVAKAMENTPQSDPFSVAEQGQLKVP